LDEAYPDRPPLFPGGGHAHARFIRAWADGVLNAGLGRLIVADIPALLQEAPWFGGDAPDYADYILAGSFMWARAVSRFAVLADDDPVAAWFGRVLDLFDGMGRKAKTA